MIIQLCTGFEGNCPPHYRYFLQIKHEKPAERLGGSMEELQELRRIQLSGSSESSGSPHG